MPGRRAIAGASPPSVHELCRDRTTSFLLSTLYAAIVRRRREHYARRPELRQRLSRPVISVGNLAVGGRGKTPMVATITRELLGDPVRRARLGAAARALVEANRGARAKTLAAIAQLLPPDNPGSVVRPFRRVT